MNMRKIIPILCILISFSALSKDSAYYYKKYAGEKTTQGKAVVLEAFIDEKYSFQEVDSFFLENLPKLLEQAQTEENLYAANIARLGLVFLYQYIDKIDESISLLNTVGDYFFRTEQYKNHFHKVQRMAVMYSTKGLHKESLNQTVILDELKPLLGNWANLSTISRIKGDAYLGLKNFDKALHYHHNYLKEALALKRVDLIANAYAGLGIDYQMKEDFKKAEMYFSKAAEFAYKSGSINQECNANTSLAIIEFYQGNNESAKDYFIKTLEIRRKSKNSMLICNSLYNVGVFYFDTGDFKNAIIYFTEMYDIAKKQGLLERQEEALLEFAHLYDQMGKKELSIESYEKYISVKQEMLEKSLEENKEFYASFAAVNLREEKLRFQQKENQLVAKIENANHKFYGLVIGFLIITLISAVLLVRNRPKEDSNSILEESITEK